MANYKDIIVNCKDIKGGIIEAFHALQKEFNYIPREALVEAAHVFKVSEAQAYGVATFYSYLSIEKRGKYIIRMCQSAPCHVAGADELLNAMKNQLNIKVGETTPDGKFTLELTDCVGQCHATPIITINSEPIFNVTSKNLPQVLDAYK